MSGSGCWGSDVRNRYHILRVSLFICLNHSTIILSVCSIFGDMEQGEGRKNSVEKIGGDVAAVIGEFLEDGFVQGDVLLSSSFVAFDAHFTGELFAVAV